MPAKAASILLFLFVLSFGPVASLYALQPELAVPEKVSSTHKACREILRLGKKYQVEGLFTSEFVEGKCELSRLDVAVAVQLLTERLADRAAREGAGSVDREDLALLADLREELRGEMLLAQARAFQSRYTELGTNLHALTRNITMSGGMTGVVQGSFGNGPSDRVDAAGTPLRDHADAVGRADVVFNFKIGDATIAVIDVEATGGSGVDAHVPNFSILNNVPLPPSDTVRFRTAWLEHTAFSERLIVTAGKVDLTDYFDSNNVANNENTQFLAGAFTNSPILGAPNPGPGMRMTLRPTEDATISIGYAASQTDPSSPNPKASDLFDHGYGIAELDYRLKAGGLEGNFRAYGSMDGSLIVPGGAKISRDDGLGAGLSVDQQVTDRLTLYGRYGWRDPDLYVTYSAWSAGFQFDGPVPGRPDDYAAASYGQIVCKGSSAQEKLVEAYYKVKLNDQVAFSPHLQYLMDPLGDKTLHNVFVASSRLQVTF